LKNPGILFFLSLLFWSACTQKELPIPEGENQLVVEGWVTQDKDSQWIKLSRTTAFTDSLPEIPVTDASVFVEDLQGNIFDYNHDGNGRYQSIGFRGQVNQRYRLNITLGDGRELRSDFERLNPVSPIDTITYDFFVDQDEDTGEDVRVYFPIIFSSDPIEQINYYRYIAFRNGDKLNAPEEIFILDDRFINGQNLANEIPDFRYEAEDTIVVQLHSLSRSAFDFLNLLKLQTTVLGSSSGTAPASLTGNVFFQENNTPVLGYFGASAVSADTTVVID
jgi:hypothetical protein